MYILTKTIPKMPPVSPPVMINVKQFKVREILFLYFNGGARRKVWEPLA
jgi:hypothetical protein